jgi:hypothetical protein
MPAIGVVEVEAKAAEAARRRGANEFADEIGNC